jgi:pimeloyl-ACP methyl ester carboxylesterase
MFTTHDDITIAYETTGDGGEPLLLVHSIGQLISWPDDLCELLHQAGFHVARFDNRDVGLSTHLHDSGTPNPLQLTFRPRSAAPYSLTDLAEDARSVLDALGWPSAHILGFSQGGMIAQRLATIAPGRVRTLTSISSTPSPRIGRPSIGTLLAIAKIARRPVTSAQDYVRHMLDLQKLIATPRYPADEDWLRDLAARSYERCHDQPGVQRQSAAYQSSGDRRSELATLSCPTLVMHGDADVMVRLAGGKATARAIPGAEFVVHPGLGHDLPRGLWPDLVSRLSAHAARG